ncbi:hypothetical protein J7W08_09940 [Methanococcoides orientis]|uniref:hypothetical protein n=1 Tax=Methanococcoides orientis TaxID=2822137 RepID=UPI001E3CB66B|nr:hypothetical protein [Methanococcoides orientis]UGV40386.1 hypothetical protein J7W08_09940 [Methanococcoides orientis]
MAPKYNAFNVSSIKEVAIVMFKKKEKEKENSRKSAKPAALKENEERIMSH